MGIKKKAVAVASKSRYGREIIESPRSRILASAGVGLILNIVFALYNGVLGALNGSVWFAALCVYYIILSIMRYAAIHWEKKNAVLGGMSELSVMRLSGAMLIVLSVVLAITNLISMRQNLEIRHDTIVMITIALYTTCKVTLAIVNAFKVKKRKSYLLTALRNIGCADAAASVLSLQRSMLVSFEGMSEMEIKLMNILTGAAVFVFVMLVGIAMVSKKERE